MRTQRPDSSREGAHIVTRQPAERVVTPEVVRHLKDAGASRDLVDFAQKHVVRPGSNGDTRR
jgi:hypothetical protein